MQNKIRQKLLLKKENKYKEFMSKLILNEDNILGVRVPCLRKLAKEIIKNISWYEYLNYSNLYYNEEFLIAGMIIGYLKIPYEDRIKLIKNFIPNINNWMVCDTFCSELKFVKDNKKKFFKIILKYLDSNKTYEIRFALVILLKYYIEKEYLDEIFKILHNIKSNEYYVEMGAAWLIAEMMAVFYDETKNFLEKDEIKKSIKLKAYRKVRESRKILL